MNSGRDAQGATFQAKLFIAVRVDKKKLKGARQGDGS